VVEGVYANRGDVAPLRDIHALKERYKYRLCVEETHALGVLGAHGRGACEEAGLRPGEVEVICASMGTALASVGGFCAGSHDVCDHQRLSGSGYCFSASLPPFLATAATAALGVLRSPAGAELRARARGAAAALRAALRGAAPGLLELVGAEGSDEAAPVLHLRLAHQAVEGPQAEARLQQVADHLLEKHGMLVSVARYSRLDRHPPPPSLKLHAHAGLSGQQAEQIGRAVAAAARAVLGHGTTTR
jgi:serine palmitoyltransferase